MPTRIRSAAALPRFVTLCAAVASFGLAVGAAPAALHAQTVPERGQANATSAGHARVDGRVLAPNGNPLAFATVELLDLRRSTITDETGKFGFDRVPAGEHPLRVRMVGYQSHSRPITTANGTGIEVRLGEDPVLLTGLTVTTGRFERRLKGVPYAVRVQGKSDVYASAASDAAQFVISSGSLVAVPCASRSLNRCFLIRGRAVSPSVFIDDAPAPAGVDMLAVVPREEIGRVEMIRNGAEIRVYTDRFLEWAARHNYRPRALASY